MGERRQRLLRQDCDPWYPVGNGNGTGGLEFFDFLCFQDLFAAGAPAADCDGDGDLTLFDFLCYQDLFIAGCPWRPLPAGSRAVELQVVEPEASPRCSV